MPAGWFTASVRGWWPDFKSDLCTAGHPLCILTATAISADKRAESAREIAPKGSQR